MNNDNSKEPRMRLPYEAPHIIAMWHQKRRSLLETFSLETTFIDFEEDENTDF